MVSSQFRRALAVTAYQRRVNCACRSPIRLHRVSLVRSSEATSRTVVFDSLGAKARVVSCLDRRDGVPSYPARLPLAAPPCPAPTRLARSFSGFWIRQVSQNTLTSCFYPEPLFTLHIEPSSFSKTYFGDVSSIFVGLQGSLFIWANCSIGSLSCPAPLLGGRGKQPFLWKLSRQEP